jgi:hypothetical protein
LQRLRENIMLAEAQFNSLKIEFDRYLSQISSMDEG